jgi:hypothetical protein
MQLMPQQRNAPPEPSHEILREALPPLPGLKRLWDDSTIKHKPKSPAELLRELSGNRRNEASSGDSINA